MLDVAVVRAPIDEPGVVLSWLVDQPLVVAFPEAHSLAADSAPLTLGEISDLHFVLPPAVPGPAPYQPILQCAHLAGLDGRLADNGAPSASALVMVAAGRSVALVPEELARLYAQEGVRWRPLADPPTVALHVARPRDHASSIVTSFVEELHEAASSVRSRLHPCETPRAGRGPLSERAGLRAG